jgi:DNA replication protein DnaC
MQYNDDVRADTGLVGRDDELAVLREFLDGSGRGALAIRGDAGVGKTALTAELCRRAADDGWRLLRAIGVEAEKQFALSGLNQMVFRLRDELARLDARDREVLAPVFGVTSRAALAAAMRDLD